MNYEARFWARVRIGDGCWEWVGAANDCGYGQMRVDGRTTYAHRLSWTLAHGAIPDGLFVCHTCDNPRCVRPSHLFLGTAKDNVGDMMRKRRGRGQTGPGNALPRPRNPLRGEQIDSARFTAAQVIEIRRRVAAGETQVAVAASLGVRQPTISGIVLRKSWRHLQ